MEFLEQQQETKKVLKEKKHKQVKKGLKRGIVTTITSTSLSKIWGRYLGEM